MGGNKHYIIVNDAGLIVRGWSDGPRPTDSTEGAVMLTDEGSFQFRLTPDGKENPILTTMDNITLYRWDGTQVVTRTEEEIEADREQNISAIKENKISKSKTDLDLYLRNNPLTWTDGKQYSATEDKQALLTGNIASYQLAVALGEQPELTWNATGEECTVWSFETLASLAVEIKAYVKPLVAYQQAVEVQINSCETIASVNDIVIDYSSVYNNEEST